MNKKALFLSIAITTFVLVIIGGVFSVYKAFANSAEPVAQGHPVSQVVSTLTAPAAASSAVQQVTPKQAAAIAAEYLGRKDVYSIESAVLNAVTVYKVTFSSGDIVYVGLEGQILHTERPHQSITVGSSNPSIFSIITDHAEYEHESDDD